MGAIFVAFSVEMSGRKSATEFLLANTLLMFRKLAKEHSENATNSFIRVFAKEPARVWFWCFDRLLTLPKFGLLQS